jgi:Trk K+ transport system NAD-binding subunit
MPPRSSARRPAREVGQAFVPEPGTVLQEGDVIHVVAKESELDRIAAIFASRGGEH